MIRRPLQSAQVHGRRGKGHASTDEQATIELQIWQAWLKHVAVTSKVKTVAKVRAGRPNQQKFVTNSQTNAKKKREGREPAWSIPNSTPDISPLTTTSTMTTRYEHVENVVMISDDGHHRVSHIVRKEADGKTTVETTHDSNLGDRLLVLVVTPALIDDTGKIFTATCHSYEVGATPMMECLKPVRLVSPPSNSRLTEGVLWAKGTDSEVLSFVIHSYDEWSRTYTGELIRRGPDWMHDDDGKDRQFVNDGASSRVYFPGHMAINRAHDHSDEDDE
jgi:hypothetical protein